jgi:hypothetical protein
VEGDPAAVQKFNLGGGSDTATPILGSQLANDPKRNIGWEMGIARVIFERLEKSRPLGELDTMSCASNENQKR